MTRAPALAQYAPPARGAWLDAPAGAAGIPLGMEQPGVPALVRLFRPQPTTAAIFGPAVLARLLAMRALTAGAQVCVLTPQPGPWTALHQVAPSSAPWLTLLPPGSEVPTPGAGLLPWLLIDDAEPGATSTLPALGPWQAAVTSQPPLAPHAVGSARSYDLLVLHGVASQAVDPLRAATGISERSAKWLGQMPDDVVALIAGGEARYAKMSLEPAERAVLGMSSVTRR
jgi:hypothetical protein